MEWTSIIQTVVGVIGFAAVVYQLRQVERSVRSATRWSIYDMAGRIKQNFIDNPELKPYFDENKEITAEDGDYLKVMAMADYYCLYLEKITTQAEGLSEANVNAWNEYIRGRYSNSYVIRKHLEGKEQWYSKEFWAVINQK
jgi:hypothetical protein